MRGTYIRGVVMKESKNVRRVITVVIMILFSCTVCNGDKINFNVIREPAVAGQFYSNDADVLEQGINDFIADALPGFSQKPVAIITPHAGYIYSGQICADAFKQAMGHNYDLVVILGINHTVPGFNRVSVYRGDGYRTPLGIAEIDTGLAEALAACDSRFAFYPSVHVREHSVEVQLPFVQSLFPGVRVITAVIGVSDPKLCRDFGLALAEKIKDRRTLIVASSDLSHYPSYDDARDVDRHTLEAIQTLDTTRFQRVIKEQMSRKISNLSTCACGEGAILAAMEAAKALGGTDAHIISYANSGDVAVGNRSRVVGYGAVAIWKTPLEGVPGPFETNETPMLQTPMSDREHRVLLDFARRNIERYLTTQILPLTRGFDSSFYANRGAFVTIRKHGSLRGCIGHMAWDTPLISVVGGMAFQAAFQDRRFPPLSRDEMSDVELEISVLTPCSLVDGAGDIVTGRDGVMIHKNGRSAVYLPQVAPEQRWDVIETLEHLCQKAGLAKDAWKEGAELYTFQAEVFSEGEYLKQLDH